MSVLICPGIHPPNLTREFCQSLALRSENCLIFPAQNYPPYSGIDVLNFLNTHGKKSDRLLCIAFSAGVVGAIFAALGWQYQGGTISAFIALDGWGVPLGGNFPIHRLSHDYFTHWSSLLLGSGEENFYADPEVEHLALWRSPDTVRGWRNLGNRKTRCSASQFLLDLLQRYNSST